MDIACIFEFVTSFLCLKKLTISLIVQGLFCDDIRILRNEACVISPKKIPFPFYGNLSS